MTNEERCRSQLQLQFGSASASFFSSFFLFSLISLNAGPWNPFFSPHHSYLLEMMGFGTLVARSGELLLQPEVTLLAQAS